MEVVTNRPEEAGRTPFVPRMKARTAPLHQATEKNSFFTRIGAGDLTVGEYSRYLASLVPVMERLEAAFANLHGELADVVGASEFRFSKLLAADLAHYQMHGKPVPESAAVREFLAEIDRLAKEEPEALLGAVYLIVGSQHGAGFMANALQKKGVVGADFEGGFYLKGKGLSPIHARWVNFTKALEQYAGAKPDVQEKIIRTLEHGYGFMSRLGDELTQNA